VADNIVPCQLDEANASEPKSEVETYEAMDAGQDRIDFWNANKRTIYAQMEARTESDSDK
jgi:hypothetical protein